MAPLKLVDRLGAHKTERNLSCINSILMMLKSIPDIDKMFQTKSYKTGSEDDMPICDKISGLFKTEKKEESTAAYLRMLIRRHTAEQFSCFGEQQDLAIFFRILYDLVSKELDASNQKSKNLWKKFRRNYLVSCSNCERLNNRGTTEMLSVSALEGTKTTVTRLINCFKIDPEENQDKECLLCHANKSSKGRNSYVHLPDYLLVKIARTKATSGSIVFPENRMKLLNGDTYKLTCIVSQDPRTGRYVTSVVDDNTWVRCDGTEHTTASKEEVKNEDNLIFLYVKQAVSSDRYKCSVAGCPLDTRLESRQALRRHMKREHPRCEGCKETFLINCLYKEHLQDNKVCQIGKRSNVKKVKINSSKQENKDELLKDSGLESMSDSSEENIKVCVNKNSSGQFEVKCNPHKRKIQVDEANDLHVKKQRSTLLNCNNVGCHEIGKHCCQYSPIISFGDSIKTSGSLLRERSLVNGVSRFVPFNNSFLEKLGCQFYFKNMGGVIKIFSYSLHQEEYEYRLTLSSKNTARTSEMRAKIGEKRSVAAYELDSSCVHYDLVIHSKTVNLLK